MKKYIQATWHVFLSLSLLLMAGSAHAKDRELINDMVALEKAFIPVIFYTNKPVPPKVPGAMDNLQQTWDAFYAQYHRYRPSQTNWVKRLENVDFHVAMAAHYVQQGPASYLQAHEDALEPMRTAMRELRRSNGFPKFETDLLTDFHTLMGAMFAVVMSPDYGDADRATLERLYARASKAWSTVEKNPVDPALWGLSDEKVMAYNMAVEAERLALDMLESALASGDPAMIKSAVKGIKPAQAQAYLILGGVL